MIKISAPDGPFSLMISHKGYEIVFFALPDEEDMMQCDFKVFKDNINVSDEFDESGILSPDSYTLYKILNQIENNN